MPHTHTHTPSHEVLSYASKQRVKKFGLTLQVAHQPATPGLIPKQ